MQRKVPPLEMVEMFVAAARASSLRAVASATSLSPSAVSRRIAGLEHFLGVALFDRVGQTVRLNAVGQRYLELVEPAIGVIRDAGGTVGRHEPSELRIAASDSFQSCWLQPRLAQAQVHCGLNIEVVASRDPATVRSGQADLGIWGGLVQQPGLRADLLFDVDAIPVATPAAIEGRRGPLDEAEIARLSLIGVSSPSGLWERWFALGEYRPATLKLREYPTMRQAYQTAAAGLGVALAVPLMAERLLDEGRLVPIAGPRRIGEAYRVYRVDRAATKAQILFADWLHEEVTGSLRRFGRVAKTFEAAAAQ